MRPTTSAFDRAAATKRGKRAAMCDAFVQQLRERIEIRSEAIDVQQNDSSINLNRHHESRRLLGDEYVSSTFGDRPNYCGVH
jgi:hypothetical protein